MPARSCIRTPGFAAGLVALALTACTSPQESEPLPTVRIDPARVAVAGVSSGAYMATQAHFAFGDRVHGVALIAGGPYGCAEGDLQRALGPCMKAEPAPPDIARLAGHAAERADAGAIAPLSALDGDRILILHAADDPVVAPVLAEASARLYRRLADGVNVEPDIRLDTTQRFGHALPTVDAGGPCGAASAGDAYIARCGFDAAAAVFAHLFGAPAGDAGAAPAGTLRSFDQPSLLAGVDAQLHSHGHLYVPPACTGDAACGLLTVFHGCEQSAEKIGERFVREAGFNRWADVYGVVVLYPQARSSYMPLNPKGCWDWWGYSGPDYDSRDGVQLRWLAAAWKKVGL